MLGVLQDLLYLWPLVVVPAVMFLLIRPMGRLAFFLLGLIVCLITNYLVDFGGGPHNPAGLIPVGALCISVAALFAELFAQVVGGMFKLAHRWRTP